MPAVYDHLVIASAPTEAYRTRKAKKEGWPGQARWQVSRLQPSPGPSLVAPTKPSPSHYNFLLALFHLSIKGARGVKPGRVPEGEQIIEVVSDGDYYILEFYDDGTILFALLGDNGFEGSEITGKEIEQATTAIVNGAAATI